MARAVIDKRGLLGVHINGLNHHGRLHADALGINPLDRGVIATVLANAFAVRYPHGTSSLNGERRAVGFDIKTTNFRSLSRHTCLTRRQVT